MVAYLLALAAGPQLAVPIACRIGAECVIQKHYDLAPGPERRDYRCGTVTTDEHDGIDFRPRNAAAVSRGVAVLAAADGTVLRVRDGEPDLSSTGRAVPPDRMAGNGIVVRHADGLETQYSHLRRGSLKVRPGDKVTAGQAMAMVGLSGFTEYPHLHFSVRRNGRPVDPFGGNAGTGCRRSGAPLWSAAALRQMPYTPSAVIASGFATGPAQAEAARLGRYLNTSLTPGQPIVLWADALGARPGDQQRFTIEGPGGVVHRQQSVIEQGGLSWFAFSGDRPPPQGWPRGAYRGAYELFRDGQRIGGVTVTATMR